MTIQITKPYWNFSDNRRAPLSLDEFLDQQDPDTFFTGKEPWLMGVDKIRWNTFYRVCTDEMDDLSHRAVKLVVEYCLEILEAAEGKIQGNPTLPRLEKTLNHGYTEQYENPRVRSRRFREMAHKVLWVSFGPAYGSRTWSVIESSTTGTIVPV